MDEETQDMLDDYMRVLITLNREWCTRIIHRIRGNDERFLITIVMEVRDENYPLEIHQVTQKTLTLFAVDQKAFVRAAVRRSLERAADPLMFSTGHELKLP